MRGRETRLYNIIFPIWLLWFFPPACSRWFGRKLAFGKAPLAEEQRRRPALSPAAFTAPYLFFLPMKWFLRFRDRARSARSFLKYFLICCKNY